MEPKKPAPSVPPCLPQLQVLGTGFVGIACRGLVVCTLAEGRVQLGRPRCVAV